MPLRDLIVECLSDNVMKSGTTYPVTARRLIWSMFFQADLIAQAHDGIPSRYHRSLARTCEQPFATLLSRLRQAFASAPC